MALVSALAVGLGGSVGALARYRVGLAVERRALDTLVVNVLGSLLLGVVLGVDLAGPVSLAVAVGFCGAFTTFSSFAVETVRFADDGARAVAVAYAVGTLALALLATVAGLAGGHAIS